MYWNVDWLNHDVFHAINLRATVNVRRLQLFCSELPYRFGHHANEDYVFCLRIEPSSF